MKKRRGSCLAIIAILLFLIVFLLSQPNYLRYLWNLRENRRIPEDIDLSPLEGRLLHGEPAIMPDNRYELGEEWDYLDNGKLKNWRERPYTLFFRTREDLIFEGAEILELPASLDVYWRIDSPSPGDLVPAYNPKENHTSARIVTTLGLKRREKLPKSSYRRLEYIFRFAFYFSTTSGDTVSADSRLWLDIK